MSILVLFLAGSLAIGIALAVMLAFTRAVLYANVLTELDGACEIQRRLLRRRRPALR